MVKIRVISNKRYTTEVYVDNKLAYSTGHHRGIEAENLRILVVLLGLEGATEVVEEEGK